MMDNGGRATHRRQRPVLGKIFRTFQCAEGPGILTAINEFEKQTQHFPANLLDTKPNEGKSG